MPWNSNKQTNQLTMISFLFVERETEWQSVKMASDQNAELL